jgi:hypothetical protein
MLLCEKGTQGVKGGSVVCPHCTYGRVLLFEMSRDLACSGLVLFGVDWQRVAQLGARAKVSCQCDRVCGCGQKWTCMARMAKAESTVCLLGMCGGLGACGRLGMGCRGQRGVGLCACAFGLRSSLAVCGCGWEHGRMAPSVGGVLRA